MARKSKSASKTAPKAVAESTNQNGISKGDNPVDVWDKTRKACVLAVEKALQKTIDALELKEEEMKRDSKEVAKEYEENLYKRFDTNMNRYRQRFRKELIALRNVDAGFSEGFLLGEMDVDEFCGLDEADLISKRQKRENKELLQKELRASIGGAKPEHLSDVPQNTVIREKWGVSESAAKVDPMFENI